MVVSNQLIGSNNSPKDLNLIEENTNISSEKSVTQKIDKEFSQKKLEDKIGNIPINSRKALKSKFGKGTAKPATGKQRFKEESSGKNIKLKKSYRNTVQAMKGSINL